MSVIRLKAGQACHRCGSAVALPHADHHDCVDAIGQDVRTLLERTRQLNARRRELIEKQALDIERRHKQVKAKLDALRTRRQRNHSA